MVQIKAALATLLICWTTAAYSGEPPDASGDRAVRVFEFDGGLASDGTSWRECRVAGNPNSTEQQIAASLSKLEADSVVKIGLGSCKVTDSICGTFAKFKYLQVINLSDTRVTGTRLSALRDNERLQVLQLSGLALHESAATEIATLSRLTALYAYHCDLSEQSVSELVRSRPTLSVYWTPQLPGDIRQALMECGPRVAILPSRDKDGVKGYFGSKPSLFSYVLVGDDNVEPETLSALCRCPELKTISISGRWFTDKHAESLRQASKVGLVRLNDTSISAGALAKLAEMDAVQIELHGRFSTDLKGAALRHKNVQIK